MPNAKCVYVAYSARYWALTSKLISEGVRIHFLQPLDDLTPPEDWAFYNNPSVTFFATLQDALIGVDFAIGFELDAVAQLRAHCTLLNIPLLEHPPQASLLESDRELAKSYVSKHRHLAVVPRVVCSSWESRRSDLETAYNSFGRMVVKQGPRSPTSIMDNRTQFVMDEVALARVSQSFDLEGNPYFFYGRSAITKISNWVGGYIVDKFIDGTELNIGGFFKDGSFVGSVYISKEYKDPIDGNLSGTMTGEVGSIFEWLSLDELQLTDGLRQLFDDFGSILRQVDAHGPVDVNFIMDSNGVAHFVEFTMRWGRPPMESWLAHMTQDGVNVGDFLFSLVQGGVKSSFSFPHRYSVTSVVFHYGIPLITSHIPYAKYAMPNGVKDCVTLPLMSKPTCDWVANGLPQSYYLCDNDGRHFLAVGLSHSSVADAGLKTSGYLDNARKLGFIPQGCIYRRDIGMDIDAGLKDLFWVTESGDTNE